MTRHGRPPSFTKAQRYEVAITYGAVILCQSCGFALYVSDMVIDHHQAWIDDGEHVLDNWRPLCFGCNSAKGVVEHKNNAKSKRIAKKLSGHDAKPKRRIQGRAFPLRGRTSWPETSPPLPSRSFPKRRPTTEAAE